VDELREATVAQERVAGVVEHDRRSAEARDLAERLRDGAEEKDGLKREMERLETERDAALTETLGRTGERG
jgi:hypothetical protein